MNTSLKTMESGAVDFQGTVLTKLSDYKKIAVWVLKGNKTGNDRHRISCHLQILYRLRKTFLLQ